MGASRLPAGALEDLGEYRRLLLTKSKGNGSGNGESDTRDGATRRAERRAAAKQRRELEPLRRRVRDAEARVAALARDVAGLETELATPATYGGDSGHLTELLRRQAELRAALSAAESDWLAASEALEAAR